MEAEELNTEGGQNEDVKVSGKAEVEVMLEDKEGVTA